MDWQDGIDGFDFDKNGVFYDEIGPVAAVETNAFINSRQHNLSFELQAGTRKFQREAILIILFKKPRPRTL
jgi:hypothetical protein